MHDGESAGLGEVLLRILNQHPVYSVITVYDKVIGVITASPRKEIEQQCKTRGADFFLEKNNDWQNQLCRIMNNYINDGNDDEDDF